MDENKFTLLFDTIKHIILGFFIIITVLLTIFYFLVVPLLEKDLEINNSTILEGYTLHQTYFGEQEIRWNGKTCIAANVLDIQHNDRYICAKQVGEKQNPNDMNVDWNEAKYYIIDTFSDAMYGPYSFAEYQLLINQFGITIKELQGK